jgi:hypothetical protein
MIKKTIVSLIFAAIVAQPGPCAPVVDRTLRVLETRLFPDLVQLDGTGMPGSIHAMLKERHRRYTACGSDAACKVSASIWSDQERDGLVDAGAVMLQRTKHIAQTEARTGLRREIDGLNAILRVYGQGAEPRYPKIDGPDAAKDKERFANEIAIAAALSEAGGTVPSIDRSVDLALSLLDVSGRLDAVAFEPLNETHNLAVIERSRTLDWSRYRYTAILLLGIGPDDLTTPLSAGGKLNVRLAAKRYFDGVAPFIIVTGAMVHPRGAHFAEAVEMRRALIERYGIPAEAIVLEPYARHTTTNLRNASRLLAALHAPANRDALIVSNTQQIAYIDSDEFHQRCPRELGYQPGTIGKSTSPTELTFRPSPETARVDPADPLDP